MKFIPASEGRCFTPAGHDKTVTSRLSYKNAVDIHVTTFPAGAGMAEEVHADFTHLFFVLSGQMEVIQGGKILKTLQAEDAVLIPAGERHEIRNISSEEMTFLAMNFTE